MPYFSRSLQINSGRSHLKIYIFLDDVMYTVYVIDVQVKALGFFFDVKSCMHKPTKVRFQNQKQYVSVGLNVIHFNSSFGYGSQFIMAAYFLVRLILLLNKLTPCNIPLLHLIAT